MDDNSKLPSRFSSSYRSRSRLQKTEFLWSFIVVGKGEVCVGCLEPSSPYHHQHFHNPPNQKKNDEIRLQRTTLICGIPNSCPHFEKDLRKSTKFIPRLLTNMPAALDLEQGPSSHLIDENQHHLAALRADFK